MSKKLALFIVLLLGVVVGAPALAQADNLAKPETFEAIVLEVQDKKQLTKEDGSTSVQQNLLMKGLSGSWQGQEFNYVGIDDFEVAGQSEYRVGDKVIVRAEKDLAGAQKFYLIEYVRLGYLYLLVFVFAGLVVLIGRSFGLRSLISLVISFLVIIKFIIPLILNSYPPLLVAVFGSALILGSAIYITDGVNKKTHVAMVSVIFCLAITFFISWFFVTLTRLTGFAVEEASFLVGIGSGVVDFRGLLLAGILIGALGVLDDVILSQVEAVEQIRGANPKLSDFEVAKRAGKIGTTHMGAIVNTLFLTYAGASLPVLILFTLNDQAGITVWQAINSEVMATEIVRTMAGSMGIVLSFPISTFIATKFLKKS